jgi:osmotically-inducible protein OsmY
MKPLLLIAVIAMCVGCERASKPNAASSQPDNTAVNERDRSSTATTPIDQNENQADVDTTAAIRKRVVDTKMSVDAQNVKIITQDGRVTLRGPVKSDTEKKRIEEIAGSVAGVSKVNNELEVAK